MRRNRPPVDWPALRAAVMARDRHRCLAPVLDPSASVEDCRGRFNAPPWAWGSGRRYALSALTLQHVWIEPGEQAMGLKPPDDEGHLLTLCWAHHIDGTGAGQTWATSRAGKAYQRKYLREFYAHPRWHGTEPCACPGFS